MPILIAIRALALSIVIFLVDYFLPLGTSPFTLSLFCFLGILSGGLCSKTKLRSIGYFSILTIATILFYLGFTLSELLILPFFSEPLSLHSLELHASLGLITFLIGAISTWAVIRSPHGLSSEVVIIIFSSIYFFSGHRNFNFQSPQILGTLAWNLGYSPLVILTALGVALLSTTLIYLRVCSSLHEKNLKLAEYPGNNKFLSNSKSLLSALCILGLFIIIGNAVFSRYKTEAEIRTANGVGQGKEENQSPLGFNSALGASNQPAALVRLDGDYSNNPFVPMLYLRESVLSTYNGVEMVAADARFDKETASIAPGGNFKLEQDPGWQYRTPLVQSIFLLSDHKLVFAVDYPVSINPLKNPNPGKFKSAFKVYSMAPGFDKDSLKNLGVGDPTWDEQTKAHYLKTNNDPRYLELAKKVTTDFNSPIEKAQALTDFLTKKAIYTLSPGHEIPSNGDQTAPFLFGDMRGYCVHFAHALVYLFRSIGIPARVGTGYLTDLSEARDGHILLRMSDRHAWAEVFISDRGWIPFDPKPEQVESHAESPVDMKLLEELMGLVGPDEEILPPDLTQGEAGLTEPSRWNLPAKNSILIAISTFIAFLAFAKLTLWFAWILPAPNSLKLKRLYRALIARISDLGINRNPGETREEYRKRVSSILGKDLLGLTSPLNSLVYSDKITEKNLLELYKKDIACLSKLSLAKKLKAIFNPASTLRYISRTGW